MFGVQEPIEFSKNATVAKRVLSLVESSGKALFVDGCLGIARNIIRQDCKLRIYTVPKEEFGRGVDSQAEEERLEISDRRPTVLISG